jgi:hypothetical protein
MALDEQQRDRLAELRQASAVRATEARDESDARELEGEELAMALQAKGLKRDVDFAIINNPLGGVYALRKPDTRAIRNWESASDKQKLQLEWQIGILRHYIVDPDEKQEGARGLVWAQNSALRPGLCWETSTAFVRLMGVDVEGLQKK